MNDIEVRVVGGDSVDRFQYNEVIGAIIDGQLVGTMELAHFKHATYAPQGEVRIQHVEVLEEYRRKGVATALFNFARKENGNKLKHTNQTPDGAAWVASLGESRRKSGAARTKVRTSGNPRRDLKVEIIRRRRDARRQPRNDRGQFS